MTRALPGSQEFPGILPSSHGGTSISGVYRALSAWLSQLQVASSSLSSSPASWTARSCLARWPSQARPRPRLGLGFGFDEAFWLDFGLASASACFHLAGFGWISV